MPQQNSSDPRVSIPDSLIAVVVLAFNNPNDTVRCLDSIACLADDGFLTIVVDNGSEPAARTRLRSWVAGEWHRGDVSHVGSGDATNLKRGDLALVELPHNLGYAGGNNAGIRLALANDCAAVWILNNDTVVAEDALSRLRESLAANSSAGVIGACLLDDGPGGLVQCLGGGRYDWWLTRSRPTAAGLTLESIASGEDFPIDFVSGASMVIPANTLRSVGLLDERFFLYCEEVDYAERCRHAGRPLAVNRAAIVRHRFGGTIGSSRRLDRRSELSAYHGARSAILLVRRHRPHLLPVATAVRLGFAVLLALKGHRGLARATIAGIRSGLKWA